MKIKLLVFFLSISSASFAQNNNEQAIRELLETQRLAWNKGDLDGYMQGYVKSDSLLFVGRNGPKYGWQTTLDNYMKGYPDKAAMGTLVFDIKNIRFLTRKDAFVLGAWNVKREKDELKGWFTLLLKKIDGHWLVVADHSS